MFTTLALMVGSAIAATIVAKKSCSPEKVAKKAAKKAAREATKDYPDCFRFYASELSTLSPEGKRSVARAKKEGFWKDSNVSWRKLDNGDYLQCQPKEKF